MSNKTDMQTQLDRQAALIDSLRGKAVGGGGGVETCTVNFVTEGWGYHRSVGLTVIDGVFYPVQHDASSTAPFENVVCNSYLSFDDTSLALTVESVDGTSYAKGLGIVYIGTSDTTITISSSSSGGIVNPWA